MEITIHGILAVRDVELGITKEQLFIGSIERRWIAEVFGELEIGFAGFDDDVAGVVLRLEIGVDGELERDSVSGEEKGEHLRSRQEDLRKR